MNLLKFQQKSRTSFWNRRHTLELLLFRFINRANWIGIVHCWSRFRRDSSSIWAAARLFKTTWFCKRKTTVVCTFKATHSPGMRCSSSYWKAKPTHWTLLRGISHLWQRKPACCSTIFTCSPAKQQLCRYQNTKDIRYGAPVFFFVACFRFPLFFFLCFRYSGRLQSSWQYFRPADCKAPDSTSGLSASQEIPRHLD